QREPVTRTSFPSRRDRACPCGAGVPALLHRQGKRGRAHRTRPRSFPKPFSARALTRVRLGGVLAAMDPLLSLPRPPLQLRLLLARFPPDRSPRPRLVWLAPAPIHLRPRRHPLLRRLRPDRLCTLPGRATASLARDRADRYAPALQ